MVTQQKKKLFQFCKKFLNQYNFYYINHFLTNYYLSSHSIKVLICAVSLTSVYFDDQYFKKLTTDPLFLATSLIAHSLTVPKN